jgi:hypothetical protein
MGARGMQNGDVMNASCRQCTNFIIKPEEMELFIPGLNILSSAYGSVRADTGYCKFNDVFLTPVIACPGFTMRLSAAGMEF